MWEIVEDNKQLFMLIARWVLELGGERLGEVSGQLKQGF